jgi:thiol-disulfide isomerase/thioredoxin
VVAVRRARPALLLAGLVAAAAACRVEPDAGVVELPPAPAFHLPALDGGEVALSELRGRPVVVDFWATWCPPCIRQIPVLNAFHEAHGAEVEVLGIAVDVQGRTVVAPFAKEHDIRYRVLLGDESLAQRYGAFGFPTLFFIDSEGRVDSVHTGVATVEELEAALARVARTPSSRGEDATKPPS